MPKVKQDPSGRTKSRANKGRWRLFTQIVGELLLTLAVLVALFVAWQLWWTNVETSNHQQAAVEKFFEEPKIVSTPSEVPKTSETPKTTPNPIASGPLKTGDTLGLMYVPRFGADYTRPIIQGTAAAQLDTLGLGHYTDTALPGEVGNFAVAGHRQTHGAVFDNIDTLVPGDKIYVQTRDSYFTYVFQSSEIVLPEQVGVILPVPNQPTVKPTESILTMTTCHPRFGDDHRFIAYSKLVDKRPISDGPPSEIKDQVKKASGGN